MPRSSTLLGTVSLDARSRTALHRQLYQALRDAVLDGRLRPGAQLPATRRLARDLDVSRNTVLAAFDQLAAEGYVVARVGSGTRVAALAPETLTHVARDRRPRRSARSPRSSPGLSARGRALTGIDRSVPPGGAAFRPGLPARAEFPFEVWSRLVARRCRRPRLDGFGYGHAHGVQPLRREIAATVGALRGVRCDADQVIVVPGVQAGIDLAARMLLDPADAAWLEDPAYPGARAALVGAGARIVPVPVDDEGIDVDAGTRACPQPRLVYVTPSHQFPTGATLALARRLALLERAREARAWVLEDDYDSEYRYRGRPLASLQGLDRDGTVVYLGTFSKTMFPALRAGFLVVPESLVDAFRTALRVTGQAVPLALQAALADFLAEGHFAAHVRRMRVLYAQRQARLVEALRQRLAGALSPRPADAGLQLAVDLVDDLDDRAVARAAQERGVVAVPLSQLYLGAPRRRGFLLGFAGTPEREIAAGVDVLARALDDVRRGRAR